MQIIDVDPEESDDITRIVTEARREGAYLHIELHHAGHKAECGGCSATPCQCKTMIMVAH